MRRPDLPALEGGDRPLAVLRGVAVQHPHGDAYRPESHEAASRAAVTRKLARLLDYEWSAEFPAPGFPAPRASTLAHQPRAHQPHVYFVPDDTLSAREARDLGIRDECDLFGGVVPHAYMKGKTITHALVSADACAPPGWQPRLPERIADLVLPGYSAFSLADASCALTRALALGPARVKLGDGIGGGGQARVDGPGQIGAVLGRLDDGQLQRHGVVIEQHLEEQATHSVGLARVGELRIAYCGTQRQTRNHQGHSVYGGSDLVVVRGGFDELLAVALPAQDVEAVRLARRFDDEVSAQVPGFFASRRNYDVILGRDAGGRERQGVLEQSWRIGGASPAEVAAMEAFRRDGETRMVRASCTEVYGDEEPPAGADVHYSNLDARVGRLTKYSMVEPLE